MAKGRAGSGGGGLGGDALERWAGVGEWQRLGVRARAAGAAGGDRGAEEMGGAGGVGRDEGEGEAFEAFGATDFVVELAAEGEAFVEVGLGGGRVAGGVGGEGEAAQEVYRGCSVADHAGGFEGCADVGLRLLVRP